MNKLKLPPRGMSTTASLIIALLSNACTSVGPSELVATHQGYHDAVQLAQSREMLSNIVRLRFGDPMQFLSVQSINAQR